MRRGRAFFVTALFLAGVTAIHAEEPGRAGRWRRTETRNFTVIYHDADTDAAETVLEIADGVYRRATVYLDYEPRERVPVVLHGGTATANGFFTPYPPHIALFVSSPTGPWLGARTESWIETVFVHELIHYLHLTRPIGFFGTASRVFGPLAATGGTIFMPGWTVEGITVHGETVLAPGGRGENPFFEMQVIAPILEERMFSYDQAAYSSPYAPRGRIYTAGYLMVDHLLRRYGEDSFVELNRTFQRAPFLGMRRAIRRTTGERTPDFYTGMIRELENRYAWRRTLPSGTVISPEGPGDWFPPVATENGLITWGRDFDRGPGLYRYHAAATGNEAGEASLSRSWQLLAPVQLAQEWSWTVDRTGTTAVVSLVVPALGGVGVAPATGESFSDLYILDLAAGDAAYHDSLGTHDVHRPVPARRLTTGQRLFHPALAPDETGLVAVARRGSWNDLVEVDLVTGAVEPLWQPEETTLAGVSFSPDGTRVVLTANHRGEQRIVLLDAAHGTILDTVEAGVPSAAFYHPRFVRAAAAEGMETQLELWYGGDRGGLLALFRSTITDDNRITPPHQVLRDQVGAWAGFPVAISDEHPVLYASYSSDGYTLKVGSVEQRRSPPPALPQPPHENPRENQHDRRPLGEPVPATPRDPLPGKRVYRDIPRPVLWLPQVSLRTGGDGDDQFDFGIYLTAPSTLGRHTVDLSAFYNPDAAQPSGELLYTFAPGPARWSARVAQDYEVLSVNDVGGDTHRSRTSTLGLEVARPLWYERHPGFHRALTAGSGVEYEVRTLAPEPDASAQRQTLDISLHGRILRRNTAAVRDFFGPTGGELALSVNYRPALLDTPHARVETTTRASLVRQPLRHVAGMIGALHLVPTAYLATSTGGEALGRLPYRSGGFDDRHTAGGDATRTEAEFAWMGRAEIRAPLGIHDAAWRGLATTGTGLSFYLEQGGAVPVNPRSNLASSLTASSVLGAETTIDLFFNMIPIRATGGAAWRVPHPGSSTERDWVFYFRLGGPVAEAVGATSRLHE